MGITVQILSNSCPSNNIKLYQQFINILIKIYPTIIIIIIIIIIL